MSEHTPGPWEVKHSRGHAYIQAVGGRKMLTHISWQAQDKIEERRIKADMSLMAAAPEMKEFLKTHLECLKSDERYHYTQQYIAELISKAEGS